MGDFHFYRLDADNRWSHKPGQTNATQFDNSNRYVTDPSKAETDMGRYRFVSFMTSNRETINIQTNDACVEL